MQLNDLSWDQYFMSMAYLASMKSKDQSSRIGAVIVGEDNEVISMGFNGLPRGVNDNLPERHERPAKYLYFAHGERNAIYAASRLGHTTKGARMYTQGTPCCGCCVGIIQAGIKEVIVDSLWENQPANVGNRAKWNNEALVSREMFEEAGVKLRVYDGPLIQELSGLFSGQRISLDKAVILN